jgi:DNA modification methylase
MVRDLLSCFPSGLKVIDPYTGSGTTRIVSGKMGFDFTGFEIDKEHFDASVKRFENYKAQLKLF